jgi:plastocyanin
MVASINAATTGNKTIDDFQKLANASGIKNPDIPSVGGGTFTTTGTGPVQHMIIVGDDNGDLTYDPPNITAMPGDSVVFSFRAKNHTGTKFDPAFSHS